MRTRLTIIVAILSISGPAIAEPPKQAVAAAVNQQQRPAEVVLASADPVRGPTAPDTHAATTPAKHRVARVTTCRCGDPQAEQEQQEQ